MKVIKELRLKKFVDVCIPSASELFARFGGSLATSGSAQSGNFSNPVNLADKYPKSDQIALGVDALRADAAGNNDGGAGSPQPATPEDMPKA